MVRRDCNPLRFRQIGKSFSNLNDNNWINRSVGLSFCAYLLDWTDFKDYCRWTVYNNTDHGVVSVDANWNNTCSTKSNYGTFSSSYDQITLTEAGTWYFICSYHCDFADQKTAFPVSSSWIDVNVVDRGKDFTGLSTCYIVDFKVFLVSLVLAVTLRPSHFGVFSCLLVVVWSRAMKFELSQ